MENNNDNQMDYIVTFRWMRDLLGLKGSELMVYALIYGFSKDGVHDFHGSASYIADWCGINRSSATMVLSKLVEKGLLIKSETYINNVKFCNYRADLSLTPCLKIEQGVFENLTGGCLKIEHYNTSYNNLEDKTSLRKENISTKEKFTKPSLEEVQSYITSKGYISSAEEFMDHYNSNGWKVGPNSMKDWQSAVRNWERNEKKKSVSKNGQRVARDYTGQYASDNDQPMMEF